MSAGWEEPSRPWASGPWSLDLRDGGELADIRHHGTLVLRAVQAVVRDHDWNTVPLLVDDVEEQDDALVLRVHSEGRGSSFDGTVAVQAAPEGLGVTLDLVSREAFDTNRTGLVVLLPPRLAGAPADVRHPDGSRRPAAFPTAISPHQPMRDIAGLAWRHGGVTAGISFEGDVFEMEDQRNWTDASFKVYSRPLALPFPYRLEAGERVVQTVALVAHRTTDAAPAASGDRIDLVPTGTRVPEIAVGASTGPDPSSARERPDRRRETTRNLVSRGGRGFPAPEGVAAVLVELDLATANWRAALARAAASGRPLDIRVVSDGSLDDLAEALDGVEVARIGVVDPADHVTHHDALDRLRRVAPTATLVGGARSHFTELNREQHRIPLDRLDGVVFSVTPLFHATGTAQLVESVAMQRLVAAQAVEIAGGLPVHVGPVTLRPRFNNVATAAPPAPTRDDLVDGYGAALTGADDPRQRSPELAAWTIASAAALAVPGVASIAFFEERGPRGIRSTDGVPYPVADAIAALGALRGDLLAGESPDGLVWALGAGVGAATGGGTGDDVDVLVANLDTRPRTVTVAVAGREAVASVPALAWKHLEKPA